MASLKRPALRVTQRALARAKRSLDEMLVEDRVPSRQPFVESLAEAYGSGWASTPCLFVLSTGRVGSKTLTALFALSGRAVSEHEPAPRLLKTSFDAYLEGPSIASSPQWRETVLAARDDQVFHAANAGRIYIETSNRFTYLAPILATTFPASRFIHLHRHPYEVVRSAMRRGYYVGHTQDFVRIRPRPDEPLAARWSELSHIEKCAWYWARVNGEARAFMQTLPEARRLDLRAEDLFEGSDAALGRIFGFAGIPLPGADAIAEVLGRKINAQKGDRFPVPTTWSESDRSAMWSQVAEVAEVLGYSP